MAKLLTASYVVSSVGTKFNAELQNGNIYFQSRCVMNRLVPFAAITFVMLKGTAIAAERPTFEFMGFPTYELTGFPITPHQFSVVGSAHVQEASPAAALTLRGMPASPHQIAVLTPHKRHIEQLAADPKSTGVVTAVRRD